MFQEKQSIKIQIQLWNYQYLLTSVSTWKHNPCMNCCTLGIQTLDLCNSRGGYFRDRATGRRGFQLTFSQVLTSWRDDAAFAKLGSVCSFQCNKHPKGENLQKKMSSCTLPSQWSLNDNAENDSNISVRKLMRTMASIKLVRFVTAKKQTETQ